MSGVSSITLPASAEAECQTDVLAEYANAPERNWSPEQKLMHAILLDAIECARRRLGETRGTAIGGLFHPKAVREARAWLWSNDEHSAFSFLRVCDALDVSPIKVRQAVGVNP